MQPSIIRELVEFLFSLDVESHECWLSNPENGFPLTENGNIAYDEWFRDNAIIDINRDEFIHEWYLLVKNWKNKNSNNKCIG